MPNITNIEEKLEYIIRELNRLSNHFDKRDEEDIVRLEKIFNNITERFERSIEEQNCKFKELQECIDERFEKTTLKIEMFYNTNQEDIKEIKSSISFYKGAIALLWVLIIATISILGLYFQYKR